MSLRFKRFEPPLLALLQRVRSSDVRRFESLSNGELLECFVPSVGELVDAMRSLAREIALACDQGIDSFGTPENDGDEPRPTGQFVALTTEMLEALPTRGVSDIVGDVAVLVQIELRQRSDRLGRLPADRLTILSECDSALHRVHIGGLALLRAFAGGELDELEPDLDEAICVRRAYGELRHGIGKLDEAPLDLRTRLRRAGTSLAVLVGRSAYPLLRVRDRFQLSQLQHRILAWLRANGGFDISVGEQLWKDLLIFLEMLREINRRQVLRAHDARTVTALRAREGIALRPVDRERLATLLGLDEALDEWIRGEDGSLERLDLILGRLQTELLQRSPGLQ